MKKPGRTGEQWTLIDSDNKIHCPSCSSTFNERIGKFLYQCEHCNLKFRIRK